MRFKGLDLNLLVALNTMLEERSVSGAALRLNLSQPAISAGLARLRQFFNDELLVPIGRQMMPTPFAESLRPVIIDLLTNAERLIATSSSFDPATSQRVFLIGASDFISTVLLTPLLRRLQHEAPSIRIDIIPSGDMLRQKFERGEIDIIITPEQYKSPDHPAELLFEEQHVIVGWKDNPVFESELTTDAYLSCGHIAVSIGSAREPSFAEGHMRGLAELRRIEVTATSFASLPFMLHQTNRLAILQERMARIYCDVLPLVMRPLPFELPPLREMALYHTARTTDAGVRWLLGKIRETAVSTEVAQPDQA